MLITLFIVVAGACVVGVIASVVMTRASNRSALGNLMLAGVLALAVLAGALALAFLLTRAVFPD